MKKCFFTVLIALAALTANAQSGRGIKIAYIDMNYILDKVPDYADAKNQLEQKAGKWKQELEVKRNDISKLKESLSQEKALLTKELIEEREEEIAFQEKELLDYQEKRFGPTGDLMTQKAVLVKPIQDQVFTIAQDLAGLRNYDFVFDKSSDLTMIVAAKKHDISDLIIKRMSRAAKQEKLSSKEIKEFEKQEAQDELESNPDYADRKKLLDDKKSARDKKMEEQKAIKDQKRKEYEERKERMRLEREAKKNGTAAPAKTTETTEAPAATTKPKTTPKSTAASKDKPVKEDASTTGSDSKTTPKTAETETSGNVENAGKTPAQIAKEERDRKIEENKRLRDEKKKKILENREAAQKAREEKIKAQQNKTTTPPAEGTTEDKPATEPTN